MSRLSGSPHRIIHYPSDILQPRPALHCIVSVAVPGLHHQSRLSHSIFSCVITSAYRTNSVSNTNVCFSLMFLFSSARMRPDDRWPSPTMVKQAASTLRPTPACLSCSISVLPSCAPAQIATLTHTSCYYRVSTLITAALAKVTPNTGSSPLPGQATAGISHYIAVARARRGNNHATKIMLPTKRQPATHHAQCNLPTPT